MSDWIEGYRQAVKDSLARYGTIIQERSYYGTLTDYDLTAHFKADPKWRDWAGDRGTKSIPAWCGSWRSFSNPDEETIQEFMGTFYEGDTSKVIVTSRVTCNCGFINDNELQNEGTISEMIAAVLREA